MSRANVQALLVRGKQAAQKYWPLVLILAVSALYARSLTGEFALDDRVYFLDNDILPNLHVRDIGKIFLYPSNYWGEHPPLRDFFFVLQYAFFHESTLGYHIVSVLLYCCTGLFIFHFLRLLYEQEVCSTGADPEARHALTGPYFVTLFFLLHPLHVESVANITGQKDILFTLFSFAALALFVKAAREGTLSRLRTSASIVLLYYCSLLSKDTGIATAVVFPILWLLYFQRAGDKLKAVGAWVIINIPAMLWIRHSMSLRSEYLGGVNEMLWMPLLDRILRAVKIVGAYVMLTIKPFPLNFGYPFDDSLSLDANFWTGAACLAGFAALFVYSWKRAKILSVGLALYALYLFPYLQIFFTMGNAYVYDRYLFVSVLGAGIVLERTGSLILKRTGITRTAAAFSAAALLVFLSLLTYNIIPSYHSDIDITRHSLEYFPNWSSSAFNYVNALIEAGKLNEARTVTDDRIPDTPPWVKDYFIGWISLEKGSVSEALPYLQRSFETCLAGGYYPYPNIPLARALVALGKFNTAKEVLGPVFTSKIYDPVGFYQAKKIRERIERLERQQPGEIQTEH